MARMTSGDMLKMAKGQLPAQMTPSHPSSADSNNYLPGPGEQVTITRHTGGMTVERRKIGDWQGAPEVTVIADK